MISSARHHHRPACSQQHAARLSRASIATCHLRRRIVLHISCRPILGTATIHEIKLFKRCGHNSGATPFPAPGAPRPNLHHTRLPGGSRCGSCVAGVMRASVLRDPPNTGVGGGYFPTGDLRLVNRGRMLKLQPVRQSRAGCPGKHPARPGAVCGATAPPLRQAKRRHTAALDCRAGGVRCGLWTPVLRDPPGRGGAMPPASS